LGPARLLFEEFGVHDTAVVGQYMPHCGNAQQVTPSLLADEVAEVDG
jgi:hypothetical protein